MTTITEAFAVFSSGESIRTRDRAEEVVNAAQFVFNNSRDPHKRELAIDAMLVAGTFYGHVWDIRVAGNSSTRDARVCLELGPIEAAAILRLAGELRDTDFTMEVRPPGGFNNWAPPSSNPMEINS